MRTLLLGMTLLLTQTAWAQFGALLGGDMPPNPEVGKCYAKCLLPLGEGETTQRVSDWREIVCSSNTTSDLVRRLRAALAYEGYASEIDSTVDAAKLDAALKRALVNFQRAKGLPAGALDFETLRQLGVDY